MVGLISFIGDMGMTQLIGLFVYPLNSRIPFCNSPTFDSAQLKRIDLISGLLLLVKGWSHDVLSISFLHPCRSAGFPKSGQREQRFPLTLSPCWIISPPTSTPCLSWALPSLPSTVKATLHGPILRGSTSPNTGRWVWCWWDSCTAFVKFAYQRWCVCL